MKLMKLYTSKSNAGMGMAYQAKHVYLFLTITTLSSSKLYHPQHNSLSMGKYYPNPGFLKILILLTGKTDN